MTVTVTDKRELKDLVEQVLDIGEFAYDCETIGVHEEDGVTDVRLDPRRASVVWLAIATQGLSFTIPMGHPVGRQIGTEKVPRQDVDRVRMVTVPKWSKPPEQLWPAEVFEILEPLFFSEDILKIGHNIKYDIEVILKYYGNDIPFPPFFDTQIAAHMLNENMHTYKLGDVVKREFGFTYDKSLGEQIERYAYAAAARYVHFDAKWTWLLYKKYAPMLEEEDLEGLWALEMDLLDVLLRMERTGALLDVGAAQKLYNELSRERDALLGHLFRLAGGKQINFNSGPQMQQLLFGKKSEGGFGLKPKLLTKGGKTGENKKPSTSKDALELYQDHPFVEKYLELQTVDRIHGTYLKAYLGGTSLKQKGKRMVEETKPSILLNGRLHANFKQHGTVTGRFSCVAGSTILQTSRGAFRFDEYMLREGDLVMTHERRMMPVLRKLYKGKEEGVRVFFSDGTTLECTEEHRLLTPTGWCYVGHLSVGSEVCSSGGIEEVHAGREEHQGCDLGVRGTGQTDPGAGCIAARHDVGQRADAREPDDRQEWFPAPAQSGEQVRLRRSQNSDGRGAGWPTVSVREVTPLGTMGVWDIEVAGDHSYATAGLLHHNCSEPNLQNIPRPDTDLGKQIRGMFIAPPQHKLIVADYSQIEYVVMAHFSRDRFLVEAFEDGLDVHQYVAAMVFGIDFDEVTKPQRTTAKNTNFAVAYGAGIDKVAAMSKISLKQAEDFHAAHQKLLPKLYRWTDSVVAECKRQRPVPHITTLLGRQRRLPTILSNNWSLKSYAERQAVNTKVQGSAADIIKLAMVRCDAKCDDEIQLSLSVHDELVLVCPDDRVEEGQDMLREAMLGKGIQSLLDVPMAIDMKVVDRWSEAK